jgi:putative selenium metabolism protein SsnA
MMERPLLITNGTIAVPGPVPRLLVDHELLIEHGVITRIAPRSTVDPVHVDTLDAHGLLVLPGFINLHAHLYGTFARGLTKSSPAQDFVGVLNNLWWRLDKALTLDDCYWSALPVLLEAIRRGTTTLFDHHASPRAVSGSLVSIARAVRQTGLRAALCYEVSDRDGETAALEGIQENVAFIASVAAGGEDHVKAMFGLHASFTLSEKTLASAVEAARDAGVGFHVHVAEAEADQEQTLRSTGMRVVKRFARSGVLGPTTIAAHCVHVNPEEMDLLASTGTVVAHNPQSNMNNAVGIADVAALRAHGVAVGLGTDAMTMDMREELRAGIWAQRLRSGDASAGFGDLVHALWTSNPAMISRIWGMPIGTLQEGSAADIILVEYRPPTPLTDESLPGHLVYGIAGAPVVTTIVGGRVLMLDGNLLLDLDEHEVAARAREAADRLWKRF